MTILGVPSPYANIFVHLALNLTPRPHAQKALNGAILHPTFIIWLPPPQREDFRSTILLPAVMSSLVAAVFSGLWRGPAWSLWVIPGTEPFPDNKKWLDATCWGQGHILLSRITPICFLLHSCILWLTRGLSPTLAQRISQHKEVNRRWENGKTPPEFNSIKGT